MSRKIILIKQELLLLVYELNRSDCWRKMRKFDLSLRSSRSSYFATFRHQLTILSDRKSGSAGMPRPISYAVFCLKKKKITMSNYSMDESICRIAQYGGCTQSRNIYY